MAYIQDYDKSSDDEIRYGTRPKGDPTPLVTEPTTQTPTTSTSTTSSPWTQKPPTDPSQLEAYIKQQLSATGQDPNTSGYWMGKWDELTKRGTELGNPDYAMQRLLGMGAGANDVPASGPYSRAAGYKGVPSSSSGGGYGDFSDDLMRQGLDPWSQSTRDTLYNMLLGRAQQSLNIDPNDPIIKRQVNAFDATQQRQSRNYLADLAEHEGPHGNVDMERRMASEHVGQATSQLEATLMQNELTARRQEIASALQQMGGLLTSQQQLALQQQVALIDAALRKGQLGLNAEQNASYWDALRAGLLG